MRLGTLANGEPINVGAYFLAGNAGQKLNIGTMASWDIPGSNPPLNGLVAAHAKLLSCGNRAAEKSYGLGDRFVFVHESHFIQEKLATQGENKEKLVVTRKGRLNKFQPMKNETIHGRIKRRPACVHLAPLHPDAVRADVAVTGGVPLKLGRILLKTGCTVGSGCRLPM
jgi:hypothetical protein